MDSDFSCLYIYLRGVGYGQIAHQSGVFMVRVIPRRETAFVCIVTSQPHPCGLSEAGGFVIYQPR